MTPNSFSDGSKFNQFEKFCERFVEVSKWAWVVDLGAESTAPMNSAVGHEEEFKRLNSTFVHYLRGGGILPERISLDTYRPETIRLIAAILYEEFNWKGELWWNDVSGLWGPEVESFLDHYPNTRYVYSFTNVPCREMTNSHQMHIDEDDEALVLRFQQFGENIPPSLCSRVLLDPAFGFSKSRTQNYLIWKTWKRLLPNSKSDWLVGISRKSFLRFSHEGQTSEQLLLESELLQALLIAEIQSTFHQKRILWSVHGPECLRSIQNYKLFL